MLRQEYVFNAYTRANSFHMVNKFQYIGHGILFERLSSFDIAHSYHLYYRLYSGAKIQHIMELYIDRLLQPIPRAVEHIGMPYREGVA